MQSNATTIEEAIQDFARMRSYAPFRFSGKWFVAAVEGGFTAFRTKKAACCKSAQVWMVTL